jgi:hypothetical protein
MREGHISRKIVSLAAVVLALPLAQGQQLSTGANLDATKMLVVMIDGTLNTQHTQGAGIVFAVSDGWTYIATAYHVVRKGDTRATDLKVRFFQEPLETFDAEHYDNAKQELDLAVLRVKTAQLSFPFTRISDMKSLKESQLVYAIGHPPSAGPWDVIYQPGSIGNIGSSILDVQYIYIKPGYSGGALIDENKMIVGMVLNTDGTSAGALRIDQIIEILRRDLKLPVQLAQLGANQNPSQLATSPGQTGTVHREDVIDSAQRKRTGEIDSLSEGEVRRVGQLEVKLKGCRSEIEGLFCEALATNIGEERQYCLVSRADNMMSRVVDDQGNVKTPSSISLADKSGAYQWECARLPKGIAVTATLLFTPARSTGSSQSGLPGPGARLQLVEFGFDVVNYASRSPTSFFLQFRGVSVTQ